MKNVWLIALAASLGGSLRADYRVTQLLGGYGNTYGDFGRAYDSGVAASRVALDKAGKLYILDYQNSSFIYYLVSSFPGVIRRITTDGRIEPVAEMGVSAFLPGQRQPALLTGARVSALTIDKDGNLFVAGFLYGGSLFRIGTDGLIESYATFPSTTGGAVLALTTDAAGNVYALGTTGAYFVSASLVYKIAPDRTVTRIAGTGVAGFSGDGGPAISAQFNATDIVADNAGNLYTADSLNGRTRKVDTNGIITNSVEAQGASTNLSRDGSGNLYFQWQGTVRRLSPDGRIDYIASGPFVGGGMAVDDAGNLYFANGNVVAVDTAGVVRTLAGCGCYGDGVPFTWAKIQNAQGLARDTAGNLYFSDQGTHMVRRIAPDGIISTIAGTGVDGFNGDGGPARHAQLSTPSGLAFDSSGNLYIADRTGHRIRRVSPDGVIQTVAGNGIGALGGDGGPAVSASLAFPEGVAIDSQGNIYIADTGNNRIRKVGTDGVIQTIAGSVPGSTGDGGPAAQALLINPRALAFDLDGNLILTDSAAHVVRRITPAGIIQRVSGTGQAGYSGDGGSAVAAKDWTPWGLAVDSAGNILIGDTGSYQVRMVDRTGTIHTLALASAKGLAADLNGRFWIADGTLSIALPTGADPPLPLAPAISDCVYCFRSGMTNAASGQPNAVAPGEIVNIDGRYLGPAEAVSAPATGDSIDSSLAGVRVLFDDLPAPLLLVQAQRIEAVVPYGIAGKKTVTVTVEYAGRSSNSVVVAVLPAVPGLFGALNQDGTPNERRAAEPGSILSLFASGGGLMVPQARDGQIDHGGAVPVLPVSAFLRNTALAGWQPIEVTYAGSAPGLVSGALQVNQAAGAFRSRAVLPLHCRHRRGR